MLGGTVGFRLNGAATGPYEIGCDVTGAAEMNSKGDLVGCADGVFEGTGSLLGLFDGDFEGEGGLVGLFDGDFVGDFVGHRGMDIGSVAHPSKSKSTKWMHKKRKVWTETTWKDADGYQHVK